MPSSSKVKKVDKSDKFLPGTKPAVILRTQDAAKQIANGKTRATVIEYLQNEYGIAYDTARHCYDDALNYILPSNDEEYRQNIIKINYERLNTIIQESMAAGNYRVAREAIAELNKMSGIHQNGITVGVATDQKNNTQQVVIRFD